MTTDTTPAALRALLDESLALAALMRLTARRLSHAVARARMAGGAEPPHIPSGLSDADTLEVICRRLGTDPATMRGRARTAPIVAQRTAVIRQLRMCGWSVVRIGRALHRDHGTIRFMLRKST